MSLLEQGLESTSEMEWDGFSNAVRELMDYFPWNNVFGSSDAYFSVAEQSYSDLLYLNGRSVDDEAYYRIAELRNDHLGSDRDARTVEQIVFIHFAFLVKDFDDILSQYIKETLAKFKSDGRFEADSNNVPVTFSPEFYIEWEKFIKSEDIEFLGRLVKSGVYGPKLIHAALEGDIDFDLFAAAVGK